MDSKKKKLPLGIENFEDLIRNDFYYIDKTGLIRDILKQPAKVTLFAIHGVPPDFFDRKLR